MIPAHVIQELLGNTVGQRIKICNLLLMTNMFLNLHLCLHNAQLTLGVKHPEMVSASLHKGQESKTSMDGIECVDMRPSIEKNCTCTYHSNDSVCIHIGMCRLEMFCL